jgi:hypothetical protein
MDLDQGGLLPHQMQLELLLVSPSQSSMLIGLRTQRSADQVMLLGRLLKILSRGFHPRKSMKGRPNFGPSLASNKTLVQLHEAHFNFKPFLSCSNDGHAADNILLVPYYT